jgi:hypothetical protein
MLGFSLRACRKTSSVRFSLYFSHSVLGFDGPQVVNIMAKSPLSWVGKHESDASDIITLVQEQNPVEHHIL